MAHIGTSTLVIETNTLRLIHFCGKKVKHESEKPKHEKYYSSSKTNPNQTLFPPDYLCTLITTGCWGVLCDMIGNPRQLSSTLTCVFYMIGKPMWPSSTLILIHIFYMIVEPRWSSSPLTLTHVSYMIREPKRLSSTLTLINPCLLHDWWT